MLILMLLASLAVSAPVTAQSADTVVNNSYIAFTIPEKDLLPENLTYDPVTEAFFVGSVRRGKILRVDSDGTISEFVAPRAHGLWAVLGMKVDAERRHLWVASSGSPNLVGFDLAGGRPSGLFRFDVDSGEFLGAWTLGAPGETTLLNDLIVLTDGTVFVTNTITDHRVYRLRPGADSLEVFFEGTDAQYFNGITVSPDERYLFIAHAAGVRRVRVDDPTEDVDLAAPDGVELGGFDGLYLHDGALVGIRDGVFRFPLDTSGLAVTGMEILEAGHPIFSAPTTGVVVGDTLFYVANSQFDRVREGMPPLERLYEVVILRLAL